MKPSLVFLGLIIIGLSFVFIQDDLINLRVKSKGTLVNMEIIEKPQSCLGTKAKWFMKVRYQGKVFPKQISGIFCEGHSIGDIIQLRYLEGVDRVVFNNENTNLEFIADGCFILLGIYLMYAGATFKK